MSNKKNEGTQHVPLPGEEGAPQEIEQDQTPAEPAPGGGDEGAGEA